MWTITSLYNIHYDDKFEINPYILKIEDCSIVRKEELSINQKIVRNEFQIIL